MNPNTWGWLRFVVILGGMALAFGLASTNTGWGRTAAVCVTMAGVTAVFAGQLIFWRCPHCKKLLPRAFAITVCPYCGETIAGEENAKQRKKKK